MPEPEPTFNRRGGDFARTIEALHRHQQEALYQLYVEQAALASEPLRPNRRQSRLVNLLRSWWETHHNRVVPALRAREARPVVIVISADTPSPVEERRGDNG